MTPEELECWSVFAASALGNSAHMSCYDPVTQKWDYDFRTKQAAEIADFMMIEREIRQWTSVSSLKYDKEHKNEGN